MGSSLVARSIQALEDLRSAMNRFSQDVTSALAANEGEIRKADEYLARRERFWQGEIRTAEADLQRAASALSSCQAYAAQAARNGGGGVSCDREAAAVQAARNQLAQAQRNLADTRRLAMQLQSEISAYQQTVQGLRSAATADAPRASSWLARHISSLREATQTGPSGVGSIVSGSVGALGGLAAGAFGAAIGGVFGARAASPPNATGMPAAPASPSTPAAPAPNPVSATATVEALQARVDDLGARDYAAQQTFVAAQQATALEAESGADPAQNLTMLPPNQASDAHIPTGLTPEAPAATEADSEREGPPGDPHWRL